MFTKWWRLVDDFAMLMTERRVQMSNNHIEEGLQGFMAAPGPESAYSLIMKCQSYLGNIASRWRDANLTRVDKIRELASEMLLILLEDFNSARVLHPRSILAFIHQRLKRLTRPARSRETAFGLTDSLPEIGRSGFTSMRLEFAEEIFLMVRGFLTGYHDEAASQLAFLFVHVFPEVPWASRLLAEKDGSDATRRLEADKKRMAAFNQNLRVQFRCLQHGDWREVTEWSAGERSHLAWRIISISPAEIGPETEAALTELNAWRERIDRRQAQSQHELAAALRVFADLRAGKTAHSSMQMATEDATPWGDTPDILLQLIGGPRDNLVLEQETEEWESRGLVSEQLPAFEDPEFIKVAEELSVWFGELCREKGKNSKQMGQKVLKYS